MGRAHSDSWGFDMGDVEADVFKPLPVGRYRFRVIDVPAGVNRKGNPYRQLVCEVIQVLRGDESSVGYKHFEYLGLEPERRGMVKGLYEQIGAHRALMPGGGPSDALGTVFDSDIVHTEGKDGRTYENFRNIEAVDVNGDSEDAYGDEDPVADEYEDTADVDDELTEEVVREMSVADLQALNDDEQLGLNLGAYRGLTKKREAVVRALWGSPEEESAAAAPAAPRKAKVGARN